MPEAAVEPVWWSLVLKNFHHKNALTSVKSYGLKYRVVV